MLSSLPFKKLPKNLPDSSKTVLMMNMRYRNAEAKKIHRDKKESEETSQLFHGLKKWKCIMLRTLQ
jgi:hypothetical protein